jgi:hypothetical protein
VRRTPQLLVPLALAALLPGCTSCDRAPSTALTSCRQGAIVQGAVKTDILFVVDDSGSMAPHQTNLANNLATFINRLKTSPVVNDFQIGVTTTSVADFNGNLTGEQGCFVGPILVGSSPTLVADFQGQVAVGTGGSGKEQPLRAMRQALAGPRPGSCTNNSGFLRPGAKLAVVILTDEDDNSESTTSVANTNDRTHNDVPAGTSGAGVDYKFTVEDPVADYAALLNGPLDGEVRDVVIGVIAGVDAATGLPTNGYSHTYGGNTSYNRWGCGSPVNNACVANVCGLNAVTNPASAPNQVMDAWCCGGATGTACTSTCAAAYDKADRLVAFLGLFDANRRVLASICDASFANALDQIAGLIISPTVPLDGAPADPALLVVRVGRPDGSSTACTLAPAGTPAAATADAVYTPPAGARSATITFSDAGACRLDQGYAIQIDVICAG